MQSISSPAVYAAGDCCSCHDWPIDETENWFQVFFSFFVSRLFKVRSIKMRLWTQAIHMGKYVARCVANHIAEEETDLDFVFMNFSHCTHFFGFRTVLLGLYNGQSLPDNETEYLLRITPNDEYIKIVVYQNKGNLVELDFCFILF